MDIDIAGYIQSGRRVLSTECVMCMECIHVCTKGALSAGFGVDRAV